MTGQQSKARHQSIREVCQAAMREDSFTQILLDTINDSIFVHDFDGRFIYLNATAYRTRGYSRDELLDMRLDQLDTEESASLIAKRIRGLQEEGEALFEAVHRRRDGSTMPVEIHCRAISLEGQQLILSIARDITHRKQAEKQHEAIMRTAMDGFWLFDSQGNLLQVNDAYCQLTGYAHEELLQMSVQDLEAKESPEQVAAHIGQIQEQGSARFVSQHRCKDGSIVDVEISVNYLGQGEKNMFAFLRDITEQKRVEAQLRASEEKYRTIIENANEALVVLQQGRVQFVNPTAMQLSGYREKELLSADFLQFIHPEDRQLARKRYQKRLEGGPHIPDRYPLRFLLKDASVRWVETSDVSISWQGKPAVLLFVTDITEQKRKEERLSHMATHDPLTGLANRTLFVEQVNLAIAKARRDKTAFSVLLLDLDNFKEVNDSLGHATGDELLKKVAQRLSATVRSSDTLCRMGGDEFLLLLPEMPTRETIAVVAKKILRTIALPFSVSSQRFTVSTSMGIALYPDDGQDPDTLIKNADVAMYQAKEGGKKRFHFYSQKSASQNEE